MSKIRLELTEDQLAYLWIALRDAERTASKEAREATDLTIKRIAIDQSFGFADVLGKVSDKIKTNEMASRVFA